MGFFCLYVFISSCFFICFCSGYAIYIFYIVFAISRHFKTIAIWLIQNQASVLKVTFLPFFLVWWLPFGPEQRESMSGTGIVESKQFGFQSHIFPTSSGLHQHPQPNWGQPVYVPQFDTCRPTAYQQIWRLILSFLWILILERPCPHCFKGRYWICSPIPAKIEWRIHTEVLKDIKFVFALWCCGIKDGFV